MLLFMISVLFSVSAFIFGSSTDHFFFCFYVEIDVDFEINVGQAHHLAL